MKPHTPKLLIIEDDPDILDTLKDLFTFEKYEVHTAADGKEGLKKVNQDVYDIVISDYKLPHISGDEILKQVHDSSPYTGTLLITAHGNIAHAVELLQYGIDDYISKPFELKEIKARAQRLLRTGKLERQVALLKLQLQKSGLEQMIIGKSPAIQNVFKQIEVVSQTDVPVVIEGESGVGKELVARSIHQLSARSKMPFIPVNCGALPDTLFESELFGYVKGAFTGADRHSIGIIENSNGGTVFLDEIGEMNINMQVKLLRTIQENEIRRVGSAQPIKVDVRFIAATNRRLKEEVSAGRFREDLYYRLNVITIRVPPLRERPTDIPILATHFLKIYSEQMGKPVREFTPRAMHHLIHHPWHGNVRELENMIQKAILMTESLMIDAPDLGFAEEPLKPEVAATSPVTAELLPFKEAKIQFERGYIQQALQASNGNMREAARRAKMDWKNFWQKVQKYNLNPIHPVEKS
ncbi:MAG: sigma-54-dependent Fis family transcriptional regulator [Gemmatimonadetes bacterium]|nr:MAG: sigma-54-dependent Fis family transcriptional regulator [Gemmatimonadota bacterium]